LPHSAVYERVIGELARRVAFVIEEMRLEPGPLPQAMPRGELTPEILEELAWRVYVLSRVTHTPLVRCHPALVLLAAEWLASPEQEAWELWVQKLG
jgi:hypothetical protein